MGGAETEKVGFVYVWRTSDSTELSGKVVFVDPVSGSFPVGAGARVPCPPPPPRKKNPLEPTLKKCVIKGDKWCVTGPTKIPDRTGVCLQCAIIKVILWQFNYKNTFPGRLDTSPWITLTTPR